MRITLWILKATDTHSEYVILIGFRLQQWLRDDDSTKLRLYVKGGPKVGISVLLITV